MKLRALFLISSLFVCLNISGQTKVESQSLKLPDLLVTNGGKKITNSAMWIKERRSEILRLFEDNIYGQVPKDYDSIRFVLKKEDKMAMGGKAKLKEVAINVYRKKQSVTINLVLFIPSSSKKPSPLFLLICHRGSNNFDPSRAVKSEFWPAEEVIERGYAIAAFQVSDVAADNKDTYNQGVLRLYPEQMKMANGMKALGAWAWGAMRAMDYFEKDKDIDSKRVAVLGHSRGGKASLWTGAQDPRFAVVISNCSGEGGAALSRRPVGEKVADLNTNFPHWFCDSYKKFSSNVEALPVDHHMLIALMAPRAVYVASASEDEWADPVGEFLSMKYAEPVYQLFGLDPLPAKEQPPVNVQVKSLKMGYHVEKGGHGLGLFDYQRYMDFADANFKNK